MQAISSTITIQNKKYDYSLSQKKRGVVRVVCTAANINQDFIEADVAGLLIDLPNLIIAEKEHSLKQTNVVRFRVSSSDKNKIEKKASKAGFDSVSDYLRNLALA